MRLKWQQQALFLSLGFFTVLLSSLALFTIKQWQILEAQKIQTALDAELPASQINVSNATTTEQELAVLRLELEKIKNQPPQIIYRTVLTPATSPTIDLKTQEELDRAQVQIASLQDQLNQLQQAQPAAAALSDSDLIQSWQAESKVARIACQDKFLNVWQFGSGVLISADGKVLTNQHVVKPSLGVVLPDYCLVLFAKDYDAASQRYAKQYRATISGFFQDRDAALLKIQDVLTLDASGNVVSEPITTTFPYFGLASGRPMIGQSVYVIGFPESTQFVFSITKGIISNLAADGIYFGTDAQIDRGNSGGAAVNTAGQLIGLPTWKFASNGDYRGYILDINSINLNSL